MSELLYEGKAKKIYSTDNPDEYRMYFKDDATAGNRAKEAQFAGKGALNCAITKNVFERINFPKTHMIRQISERELLVEKLDIIPIEVVVRNRAAGTFCKRYGVEIGKELKIPVIEYCVKDDSLQDPPICTDAILALDICPSSDLKQLYDLSRYINQYLKTSVFGKIGLELIDFKLEFGKNSKDEIILGDEICPDTMRLWDNSGKSFDKDLFRNDSGDLLDGYKEVLRRLENENKNNRKEKENIE